MRLYISIHHPTPKQDDEFIQLASISAQHAQPHHDGKYRCNALHPTAHHLRVRKTVHKSAHNGAASANNSTNGGHKPMPVHFVHGRPASTTLQLDLKDDDPEAARTLLVDVPADFRPSGSGSGHHHGGFKQQQHGHHELTRLVDHLPSTSAELFATETYVPPPAAERPNAIRRIGASDASDESIEERIVDAAGTEWSNPVYRNSSLSPEFEHMVVTDSSMVHTMHSMHQNQRQQLQQQHHLLHLPYNLSDACLACLALASGGGGGSGEVTGRPLNGERKFEQLLEESTGRTTEATATTTALSAAASGVKPPPVPHLTHDATATAKSKPSASAGTATTVDNAHESIPPLAGGHALAGTGTKGERNSVLPFSTFVAVVVP